MKQGSYGGCAGIENGEYVSSSRLTFPLDFIFAMALSRSARIKILLVIDSLFFLVELIVGQSSRSCKPHLGY
jgi:hypothetical protein